MTPAEITKLIPIPARMNVGLTSARQETMKKLLGNPRDSYSQECQPVTRASLRVMTVTENVGPFRVTGLKPAVASLKAIMADIKTAYPDIYAAMSSAGMSCARNVRGSKTAISNHSWGTAVDIKLDGKLDPYGDGTVQAGLALIAPIFNKHGWYWGADFRKEDGMHFEAGEALIRQWAEDNAIGDSAMLAVVGQRVPSVLSRGDRGPDVRKLQAALTANFAPVVADGDFGDATDKAVRAFQKSRGLTVDGRVGGKTWAMLK